MDIIFMAVSVIHSQVITHCRKHGLPTTLAFFSFVALLVDVFVLLLQEYFFLLQEYFERFSSFASVKSLPSKGGRYFNEVHAEGVAAIEQMVSVLTADGPTSKQKVTALVEMQRVARQKIDEVIEINASKKQAYAGSIPKRGQREVIIKPDAKEYKRTAPAKKRKNDGTDELSAKDCDDDSNDDADKVWQSSGFYGNCG